MTRLRKSAVRIFFKKLNKSRIFNHLSLPRLLTLDVVDLGDGDACRVNRIVSSGNQKQIAEKFKAKLMAKL